jgi:hypothetical protein
MGNHLQPSSQVASDFKKNRFNHTPLRRYLEAFKAGLSTLAALCLSATTLRAVGKQGGHDG